VRARSAPGSVLSRRHRSVAVSALRSGTASLAISAGACRARSAPWSSGRCARGGRARSGRAASSASGAVKQAATRRKCSRPHLMSHFSADDRDGNEAQTPFASSYSPRSPQHWARRPDPTVHAGTVVLGRAVPGRDLISTSTSPAGVRTRRSTSLTRPSSLMNSKLDQPRHGS
jgi:hypothetical protein